MGDDTGATWDPSSYAVASQNEGHIYEELTEGNAAPVYDRAMRTRTIWRDDHANLAQYSDITGFNASSTHDETLEPSESLAGEIDA
eukprot:m.50938 g.50938  ORF g.50938 m.50938 type:complete len:86 (+) comp48196_c0_seq1:342-599(+)